MIFHTFYNVLVAQQCVVFGHEAEDPFFFHKWSDITRIGRQVCHQCESIDELSMSCSGIENILKKDTKQKQTVIAIIKMSYD